MTMLIVDNWIRVSTVTLLPSGATTFRDSVVVSIGQRTKTMLGTFVLDRT
jgi:hypothetical protein